MIINFYKYRIAPNTLHALKKFAEKGWKNVIVVPIGFTSDHLETLYELDLEYLHEVKDKYDKVFR